MIALFNKLLDWFKALFWKEEMELTLVGLQYSGKTTFVNVIAVRERAGRGVSLSRPLRRECRSPPGRAGAAGRAAGRPGPSTARGDWGARPPSARPGWHGRAGGGDRGQGWCRDPRPWGSRGPGTRRRRSPAPAHGA